MIEAPNPGNNLHSGISQSKKEVKSKSKSNGRTNWKKMALALQEALEDTEASLIKLRVKYEDLRKQGLSEREAIVLNRLKHFQGRIVNLQVSKESRAQLDAVLEDLRYIKN